MLLIKLAHPANMAMVVAVANKRRHRQLISGHCAADSGIFHMQHPIAIAPRYNPAHTQPRRDRFGKRAAQQHAAIDIKRFNGARAGIIGDEFAIDIVFENDNVMALRQRQYRFFARIRHDRTLRVAATWYEDHPFDRPLFQRKFQCLNADPGFRIGWDLHRFNAKTAQ